MPVKARTDHPTFIDPERLYSIRGFCCASGMSYSRLREAAKAGVDLRMFRVGKRLFIHGSEGIQLIRELAQETCREMSAREAAEGGNGK